MYEAMPSTNLRMQIGAGRKELGRNQGLISATTELYLSQRDPQLGSLQSSGAAGTTAGAGVGCCRGFGGVGGQGWAWTVPPQGTATTATAVLLLPQLPRRQLSILRKSLSVLSSTPTRLFRLDPAKIRSRNSSSFLPLASCSR